MSQPTSDDPLSARVTDLEILLTHLQQTIHELNEVAIDQIRRIDALEKSLVRLRRESDRPRGMEDVGAERPPDSMDV